MKLFNRKNKIELSAEEKKIRKRERYLLILSGLMFGISFTPFPFPFTLFLFIAFVPFFFVVTKRQSLADVNKASYLTFFAMSITTIYWVGSWQSKADPFLMLSGVVLVFFLPCVMLINSSLYFLSRKVFKKDLSLYFFPMFWVTGEYILTLTDLKFPWLTIGHGLTKFTSFIQIADVVGAFGLSFIVLWINIFIFKGLKHFIDKSSSGLLNISAAAGIFVLIIIYGFIKISSSPRRRPAGPRRGRSRRAARHETPWNTSSRPRRVPCRSFGRSFPRASTPRKRRGSSRKNLRKAGRD